MGKPDAFLNIERKNQQKQDVRQRLRHYRELYLEMPEDDVREQASRCMDCGVPFCHSFGCPLGNVIPEWNELVYQGHFEDAAALLHATNNFPEITGRICPALCEAACTLGMDADAVTVRQNELAIVEKAWREGWIKPMPPLVETGKSVAVIGSGPAGLATAQQLRRAGHHVTLFEKSDRLGGLLRFGIPDFKLEKKILDRRLDQMEAEGVVFETSVNVGVDLSPAYLLKRFDAVCLCVGAAMPRDLPIPGRDLQGIHFAMDLLVQQNRYVSGLPVDGDDINAAGKKVVIVGGGDTGSDCLGTSLRQGAARVTQIEIMPQPPERRDPATPWPTWPNMMRTSTSHEEGGERMWSVGTDSFEGEGGRVKALNCHKVKWTKPEDGGRMTMEKVPGSEFTLEADLVLLAMGFTQPKHVGLLDHMGVEYDGRGNVKVDERMRTTVPKVYAAGDATTGAWLVVQAIAAGRRMARQVDLELMGESSLPEPPPRRDR